MFWWIGKEKEKEEERSSLLVPEKTLFKSYLFFPSCNNTLIGILVYCIDDDYG